MIHVSDRLTRQIWRGAPIGDSRISLHLQSAYSMHNVSCEVGSELESATCDLVTCGDERAIGFRCLTCD
jgi:hypothetical protein